LPSTQHATGKSGSLYAKARVTSERPGQVSFVLDRVLHERRVRRPHQPASTTPHARGSSPAGTYIFSGEGEKKPVAFS
jgi:hypothetical protein